MLPEPTHVARAYGLIWKSAFPLDQFEATTTDALPDIMVCESAGLSARSPVALVRAGAVYADGTRFPWQGQATFDMRNGDRVDVWPGPAWSGRVPHAFYGTVVAQLLAWRGLIPMHGCAVAIDGRAVLILGAAGAGKSSLTAGMIAAGGILISDDLSAVAFDPEAEGGASILPGRTTIRLDPMIAEWAGGERVRLPRRETRGKAVVRPAQRSGEAPVPLAGVIVLGLDPAMPSPLARAGLLASHLFRPVWMSALPGHAARQRSLLALAARLPMLGFPAVAGGGAAAHAERADAVMAVVRRL